MATAKLIAISTVGIGGILGATSPLMHIGVTSSAWKEKWFVKTNFVDPILEDCKADNSKYYTLFLEFDSGGAEGKNEPKVFFRVEETVGPWRKAKDKKVVWKKDAGTGETGAKWDMWKLDKKDNNTLDFMYPENNRYNKTERCQNRRIKPSSSSKFGSGVPVESKSIKLTLAQDGACTRYLGGVECNVNIEADNKLKWEEKFQPKVIWTAFR